MKFEELSGQIIGAAIEVHKILGPGLLESAYEECLAFELREKRISYERQKEMPIIYKGMNLEYGYRPDLLIENSIIVELKTVDKFLPVHTAQILTYIHLAKIKTGLLINFNVTVLKMVLSDLYYRFRIRPFTKKYEGYTKLHIEFKIN